MARVLIFHHMPSIISLQRSVLDERLGWGWEGGKGIKKRKGEIEAVDVYEGKEREGKRGG